MSKQAAQERKAGREAYVKKQAVADGQEDGVHTTYYRVTTAQSPNWTDARSRIFMRCSCSCGSWAEVNRTGDAASDVTDPKVIEWLEQMHQQCKAD